MSIYIYIWKFYPRVSDILIPVSLTICMITRDEKQDRKAYYMLSNTQLAHPEMPFEVACLSQGNMFFMFLYFPLLLFSLLPFILFHLFPAAPSLPPHSFLLFWDYCIAELYLSAPPVFFSTKGTLVNSLCLLLLIHNYLASHRRTRCTSLISLLFTNFTYA